MMLDHLGTQTIKTDRLTLREFRMNDAMDMYQNYCSDDEVTKYLTWESHKDVHETFDLLVIWKKQYMDIKNYNWAIEYDGSVVGGICLIVDNSNGMSAEVGYCLARNLWGKGIITEAVSAVLDFAFMEVGFNRIMAKHDVLNPASGKVMEKAGMQYEGCMRQMLPRKDGSFGDHKIYAILQEDYIASHGG